MAKVRCDIRMPIPEMTTLRPGSVGPVIHSAIKDAGAALRALYGHRLKHLVLFGSQARNEARIDSDVDLLVVLEGNVDFAREARHMLDIYFASLRNHHVVLSLIPVSASTFQDLSHPLMINIHQEGAFV